MVETKVTSVRGKVSSRKGRPNYPIDFKRRLAAAACAPDVSVAGLGQEHGINANLLFKWRRQYRAGHFGVAHADQAILLPVTTPRITRAGVAEEASTSSPLDALQARSAGPAVTESCIEIDIAGLTVRLRGEIDITQLRQVLRCLRTNA